MTVQDSQRCSNDGHRWPRRCPFDFQRIAPVSHAKLQHGLTRSTPDAPVAGNGKALRVKQTPPKARLQAKPSVTPRSLRRDDKAQYRTLHRLQNFYGFQLVYNTKEGSLCITTAPTTGVTGLQEEVASCIYLANLAQLKNFRFDFFAKIAKAIVEPKGAQSSGPVTVANALVTAAIINNYAQFRLCSLVHGFAQRDPTRFNTAGCLPEVLGNP